MHSGPEETEAELARHTRQTRAVRRRAAQLREDAGQARERAMAAILRAKLRPPRQSRRREEAEFRVEEERGARELAAYIAALRREQEMLGQEAALEDEWFRDQVMQMLEQGWTHEELRQAGFGDAFLAELGLADHPALRTGDPGAGRG